MFVRLLGLVSAALIGITGTAAAQSTGSTGGHAGHGVPSTPAAQPMQHLMATLVAPSGARAPSGMVMAHGTTVELTLAGDQAGATRPWRVHRGTCTDDQGVVGDVSKFAPVTIGTDGKGAAKATLGAPLADGGVYFVAVHASTSDMKTIVACGSLK